MKPLPVVEHFYVPEDVRPRFVTRPVFLSVDVNVTKKLSIGALSRQFPFRLIEQMTPFLQSAFLYS